MSEQQTKVWEQLVESYIFAPNEFEAQKATYRMMEFISEQVGR